MDCTAVLNGPPPRRVIVPFILRHTSRCPEPEAAGRRRLTPKWKREVANHTADQPCSAYRALDRDTPLHEFPTFQRVGQGRDGTRAQNDTNGYRLHQDHDLAPSILRQSRLPWSLPTVFAKVGAGAGVGALEWQVGAEAGVGVGAGDSEWQTGVSQWQRPGQRPPTSA